MNTEDIAIGISDGVTFHECAVENLAAGAGTFDAVLADVPCSGLGTLRQHPEIRWRRSPADLEDLASRQRAILADHAICGAGIYREERHFQRSRRVTWPILRPSRACFLP